MKQALQYSPPFDLMHTSTSIQKGSGWIYEQLFLRDIKRTYHKKAQAGTATQETIAQLNQIQSLLDLDERITAPLHGFESLNEYYEDLVVLATSKEFVNLLQLLSQKMTPL